MFRWYGVALAKVAMRFFCTLIYLAPAMIVLMAPPKDGSSILCTTSLSPAAHPVYNVRDHGTPRRIECKDRDSIIVVGALQ